MEELLDECTRRMGQIDEEIDHLNAERTEVEERAAKARFALLRKCEEAQELFRNQAKETANFAGSESWRLNT